MVIGQWYMDRRSGEMYQATSRFSTGTYICRTSTNKKTGMNPEVWKIKDKLNHWIPIELNDEDVSNGHSSIFGF